MQIKTNSIRLTLLLLSFTLSFLTLAQTSNSSKTDSTRNNPSKTELNTLFSLKLGTGLKSWGFTAGPVMQFGQLGAQQGVNFAIHINNQWSFGAGVLGNMGGEEKLNMNGSLKPRQSFSGFQLEYTPKPNSLIHISFPLMIGAIRSENQNKIDLSQQQIPSQGIMPHDYDDDHRMFDRGPAAFGIQPGVSLELNVFKYAKLFAAVNYRFAAGPNSNSDMKGISGQVGFKVGLFDRPLRKKIDVKK